MLPSDPLAPLIVLADTSQAADIQGSRAPSPIFDDTCRIKTYVKPEDWFIHGVPAHPRDLSFDQPYQWASHHTGHPWSSTNRAFLCEIAQCNLSCPYCYVPWSDVRPSTVRNVRSSEFVASFRAHAPRGAVARISGGEPMLYPEWVQGVYERLRRDAPLWVDSNMTLMLPDHVEFTGNPGQPMAICGCFKPGDADLDAQLLVMQGWLDRKLEVFLYWPAGRAMQSELKSTLEKLKAINPALPLRLTVIEIHSYTTTQSTYFKKPFRRPERHGWSDDLLSWSPPRSYMEARKVHEGFLRANYSRVEVATPSHLIPLYERSEV
jgi:hypothetical protein